MNKSQHFLPPKSLKYNDREEIECLEFFLTEHIERIKVCRYLNCGVYTSTRIQELTQELFILLNLQ